MHCSLSVYRQADRYSTGILLYNPDSSNLMGARYYIGDPEISAPSSDNI